MQPVFSSYMYAARAIDISTTLKAPEKNRCWAAVSFLFEDVCWCDWLYREFDGAYVPSTLQGRPSRDGLPYPDQLSISPSPADPLQLENYAETLQRAHYLIIVVSPSSARADVIQEHIRIFKAQGGEERIIALVVNGVPALPTGKPRSESDREWLPKWLVWRFENNAFASAGREEPIIVDARSGASSLAEVRAHLFASMLEVEVAQLAELEVSIRASPSERVLQGNLKIALEPILKLTPTPTPTPTPIPILEVAPPVLPQKHWRWPIALCGAAALAAFGCFAFWPKPDSHPLPQPVASSVSVIQTLPVTQAHALEVIAVSVEQKSMALVVPSAPVETVAEAAPTEPTVPKSSR